MDLYAELILDHSKHPQHAGLREPFDAEVHHVNTSCGDELTLRVRLANPQAGSEAVLEDISYDALGCSISMASTSILAQECRGRSLAETMATYDAMKSMLTSRGTDPGDEEVIGDGVALAGVAQYPARVKCALLGWSALLDALARSGADTSTDAETSPPSPALVGNHLDKAEK
ncbi:Fe-S cluster assembly sulfur transfer protein SufU [Gephyromycinifex aptenodytis]|uniref:Fe-S cluster assembly sulfur transfer protein SufU n=1 Tax=Gephyromycinifex aptenodytis TaxID=2716227 RepID=UPI001446AE1C|nr:SUF system NifU family Fe-S cluster assembly protein [Gephyromycinifex aptenodytis]